MILDRLFERRASVNIYDPRDPVIARMFGLTSNTTAGIAVDADSAKRATAVYTAVRVISGSIASLPLNVYRRLDGGGREPAVELPLYGVLHDAPNETQTSFEWREMMTGHTCLRSNSYSRIVRGGNGAVQALIPLNPTRVTPIERDGFRVAYRYTPKTGQSQILLQDEVFHLRGFSDDGIVGESVIEQNREAVGLARAAEIFGAAFFGNGTTVNGVLTSPNELSEPAYDRLKKSWEERYQGPYNANKPLILEDGMKWESIGIDPEKAQFLETRKFQVSEVARMFSLPPHLLGDLERATFTNIEQQSLEFIRDTLRQWLVRWTQKITQRLLTPSQRKLYFVEFDISDLKRGDSQSRAEYYMKLFNMAVLSPNDIARAEGYNPVPNGDRRYVPVNMVPVEAAGALSQAKPGDGKGGAVQQRELVDRVVRAHFPVLRQAVDKIVTAEVKAARRALNGDVAAFAERMSDFYREHRAFVLRNMLPVAETINGAMDALGEHRDGHGRYAEAFADAHIDESRAELSAAISERSIEELLDRWDRQRAADIAEREIRLASERAIGVSP